MKPKISLIIPSFNRRKQLMIALKTLVDQDYDPSEYEIIIVDNNSSDDTISYLNEYINQNKGIINASYAIEKRQGLVYTRHTGAFHAKGNILIFGDDDAIFEPNFISEVVSVYNEWPQVGAVGTKILIQWDEKPDSWVHQFESTMGKLDYGSDVIIKKGLYINGGSFSIRKEILKSLLGFNIGQKGQYLLGDCETGLCRKLANADIPIGWTPKTTVWHYQLKHINGTIKDIKRRYYNNGIARSYHDKYVINSFPLSSLVMMSSKLLKLIGITFISFLTKTKSNNFYQLLFEISYLLGYLKYFFEYRMNEKIKKTMKQKDWVFSDLYEAPPIINECRYLIR